jgi:hypothetical protein
VGGGQADGRTPRRAEDGGGGAILRMGIHAYAMGEGRIRRESQRGGREDVSTSAIARLPSLSFLSLPRTCDNFNQFTRCGLLPANICLYGACALWLGPTALGGYSGIRMRKLLGSTFYFAVCLYKYIIFSSLLW